MLTGIIVFFHVLACLTLIFVILLQVGRGHGLSGASFSQSGVQSIFGTRTASFLSKATSVMAILFVMTCISLDILQARKSKSLFDPRAGGASKIDMEKLKEVLEKIKAEQAKATDDKGKVESQPSQEAVKPGAVSPLEAKTFAQNAVSQVPATAPPQTSPQTPSSPTLQTGENPEKGG